MCRPAPSVLIRIFGSGCPGHSLPVWFFAVRCGSSALMRAVREWTFQSGNGPSSAGCPTCPSLAPCSPPSRTLRAARKRAVARRRGRAILDRGCARRLAGFRPGGRNGAQPNREASDEGVTGTKPPTPNSEEPLVPSGLLVPEMGRHLRGGTLAGYPSGEGRALLKIKCGRTPGRVATLTVQQRVLLFIRETSGRAAGIRRLAS